MNKLEISNLAKTYGNGVKAINDISLSISNGMFGLLGPNGAGKSSLMRTIAALQEPDTGTIIFNGTDIIKNPQFIRKQLGYLPQEFGVYPRMSAYKLLDHFAILKGILDNKERKNQVEALLQQTNLYGVRKKSVSTFSGGMRQRFGIAQALLGNPQIVIVDEPTAGLDPEERNRFHNLLSEIGENVIVILSTHIVEDVRDLCTNMAVIGAGKLMLQGKPKELITDLNGKIWRKEIDKKALNAHKSAYSVISSKLYSGQTQVQVFEESDPGQGFVAKSPDLEDVYFSVLAGHQTIRKEGVAC